MKKRNPYKTAQQEAMLQYFLEDKHNFLTVKDLLSSLQKLQIDIGQTLHRFHIAAGSSCYSPFPVRNRL